MHVNVVNDLTTAPANVHSEAIALASNRPLIGKLFGSEKKFPHQGGVVLFKIIDCGNVFLGYEQHMHRGFWINVLKHNEVVVFVHNIRWGVAFHNAAEYARHA